MTGTSIQSVRQSWREWRRDRPFWGGVLFVIAGIAIGYSPAQAAIQFAMVSGNAAVLGMGFGVFVALCGIFCITNPELARIFGTIGIVLSILSLFGGALGGYLLGTVLGALAGSLTVSWEPPEEGTEPSWSVVGDTLARSSAGARWILSAMTATRDTETPSQTDTAPTDIGLSGGPVDGDSSSRAPERDDPDAVERPTVGRGTLSDGGQMASTNRTDELSVRDTTDQDREDGT
jgi:hypothetical protein